MLVEGGPRSGFVQQPPKLWRLSSKPKIDTAQGAVNHNSLSSGGAVRLERIGQTVWRALMILKRGWIRSIGIALIMTASAQAAGDERSGEQLFNQCKPCHSLEPDKNGVGPTLHGLLGRKAGTVPGYNYSAAMKNSGVVWNEDTLKQYLADPRKFIPGDKMMFVGIKNQEELDDLIAYLKKATQ
jgi:cytochrome c